MKKNIFLFLFMVGLFSIKAQDQKISGVVTDGTQPIKNVEIKVQGTQELYYTDVDGRYSLKVSVGDNLVYSYTGFKTIEIRVEDVTRILNIDLFPDYLELEEVTVSKRKKRRQEDLEIDFRTDPNLINSAYGILDATTSAYQIRMLPENQKLEVDICILGILRNRFSGVNVYGDCFSGGSVGVRGGNSIFNSQGVVFDVDGLILNDAPVWIPISNIARVAVLSSFAATNRYGGIGAGGVVIINTHTANAFSLSKEIKDKARLRNNYYKGDALTSKDLFNDLPTYLQELQVSTSFEEAKNVYKYYTAKYGSSYSYYVDALLYFKTNWKDEELTNQLLTEALSLFNENPVALKALSYVLQSNGDFKKAYELNREVFIQRPNYVQSYMDLANSYRDINDQKTAASLYSRYIYLINQGFISNDSTAFSTLIDREFNNLISLHGNEFISKNVKKHVLDNDFDGTRLVFEWNDSEAEFELQFVNPEGQYFVSKHTLLANADRIADEKLLGFSCEEFLIDESLSGTWHINAKYLGNKSLTPSYIKVTTYFNYGSPEQRKLINVYKLGIKNMNQQLFKISNSSKQEL